MRRVQGERRCPFLRNLNARHRVVPNQPGTTEAFHGSTPHRTRCCPQRHHLHCEDIEETRISCFCGSITASIIPMSITSLIHSGHRDQPRQHVPLTNHWCQNGLERMALWLRMRTWRSEYSRYDLNYTRNVMRVLSQRTDFVNDGRVQVPRNTEVLLIAML